MSEMFTIIVIVPLKTTEVEKSIISLVSYHPIRPQNERIWVSVNISPFFYKFLEQTIDFANGGMQKVE